MSELVLVALLVMGACHAERAQRPGSPPAGRGVGSPAAERPGAQPAAANHLAVPCSTRGGPVGSGADVASSGAVAASSGAKDDSADDSALSSKRFVYASFFNRLKRRVFEHWAPQTARLRHRATEAAVEVRIQLSRSGALAGICVITPSGSSEFDDEAVRAFQAAAPFPDPPEGLVGKDELITFPFTFHLTPE